MHRRQRFEQKACCARHARGWYSFGTGGYAGRGHPDAHSVRLRPQAAVPQVVLMQVAVAQAVLLQVAVPQATASLVAAPQLVAHHEAASPVVA